MRTDKQPGHRREYERNKKRILAAQNICGICGQPVNKSLKYPDPGSPTVDHIIPVSKGGHPSDIDNLQLAHFKCNRAKADKLTLPPPSRASEATAIDTTTPEGLPLSLNWNAYEYNEADGTNNASELLNEAEQIKASGQIRTQRHGIQATTRKGITTS